MPNNEYLTKDTGAGGAGFHRQWDGQFVHPIRAAVITNDDNFRDLNAMAGAIENRYNLDRFHRVIYTESHDETANGRARVPEEIWPGQVDSWFSCKRSTLGAALALTAPGIPMLFQGQELLEDRWFHDKEPLDWQRVVQQGSILQMYRDLIALRRNLTEVTRGLCGQELHIFRVDHAAKLLAFHRWAEQGPGDSVIVVANMANQMLNNFALGFPRAGLWKTRFNSDSNNYSGDFSNFATPDVEATEGETDRLPCNGELSIGPYTVVVFSQDE